MKPPRIPTPILNAACGLLREYVDVDPARLVRALSEMPHERAERRAERLLTKTEAARRLGTSWSTVHRLCRAGRLEVIHPSPGTSRIRESVLEDYMATGIGPAGEEAADNE
jgi:excisionase family DNA binding protein